MEDLASQNAGGMALPIPWHTLIDPKASFPKESRKLWEAEVSWRTAMAYDSTEVSMAALKEDPKRGGVLKALTNLNFSVPGVDGAISLLPSGDRNRPMQLAVIRGHHSSKLTFVPLLQAFAFCKIYC
jgi:branched-chain amino acid transport system substrate-binding protein